MKSWACFEILNVCLGKLIHLTFANKSIRYKEHAIKICIARRGVRGWQGGGGGGKGIFPLVSSVTYGKHIDAAPVYSKSVMRNQHKIYSSHYVALIILLVLI